MNIESLVCELSKKYQSFKIDVLNENQFEMFWIAMEITEPMITDALSINITLTEDRIKFDVIYGDYGSYDEYYYSNDYDNESEFDDVDIDFQGQSQKFNQSTYVGNMSIENITMEIDEVLDYIQENLQSFTHDF